MFSPTNNHKKVALTFDLEFWHEGEWLKPYISPGQHKIDMLTESVTPILALLKKYNARATFFVTAAVSQKYPNLIKQIASEHHEIGSHSIIHTKLHHLTATEFDEGLGKQVALLCQLTGKPPVGFRAPHFSLEQKTAWILPILAKQGFRYDSSLFPIKTPEYGVANAPTEPYRISFANIKEAAVNSPLLEIPISIGKIFGFKFPIAGGIYFRLLPFWLFIRLFKKVVGNSTFPILYFHPHELCAATPKINGPFLKTTLKYWGTKNSLNKFEKLLSKFEFDTVENRLNINHTTY